MSAPAVAELVCAPYTTTATTTAEPWATDVLATPTYTPPLSDTAPPVTVVPPPVTIMAPPPTVTKTPPPVTQTPAAAIPTGEPRPRTTGVDVFQAGIDEAPPSDRMPPAAEALADGREACVMLDGGQTRTRTDETLAAEHFSGFDYGVAFSSADWIVLQAQHHLC
jgi:hypothetical protein